MGQQKFSAPKRDRALAAFDYNTDTGELTWRPHWGRPEVNKRFGGKVAGHVHTCTAGTRYIQVRLDEKLYYAHRIVWVICNGPIPDGMQIDHIDGDGTNNRLSNLRLVTAAENKRNMRRLSTNSSGRTGVHFDPRKGVYYARGWRDGRSVHIGQHKSRDVAVQLREAWEADNAYHPTHGAARPL